ncbi:glycosyltransferase [Brucella anthropi]|uniref:glycosyltransferase n=1 Tax=Brucella anthropi TaxID=529 RepID=UPI00178C3A5A|nr:glycosyltransferase [Brucella anthropi]
MRENVEKIDATIVLNLHNEALFLKRTLLSLDEAVRHTVDAGLKIQLVAVLDRADELTQEIMRKHDTSLYAAVTILDADNGSLGLSRNDGIVAAKGEYILTADGDDLISDSFIIDTISTAAKGPRECLYFPEFLFAFGASYHVSIYRPLNDVTPLAFITMHPYISRVCAHHSVFERFKYEDLRLTKGYAYEDWHFNANAVANGLDIRIVPKTILFYRQRKNSLLQQANAVSARQIAPSNLFEPSNWIRLCEPFISTIGALADTQLRAEPASRSILDIPDIQKKVHLANAIEPEIRLPPLRDAAIFTNAESPLDGALAYYHICKLIDGMSFDNVFLFPFISKGGAEKFFLEILHALYRLFPQHNCLIILGENFNGPSWRNQLPPNATVINLQHMHHDLPAETRAIITLKLIQTTSKKAHIHIRQSSFGDRFLENYGNLFADQTVVYYRFADDEGIEDGSIVTRYSPLDLITETLDSLTYVVTDNATAAKKDIQRLGAHAHKWKVLPAPIAITQSNPSNKSQLLNQILWASRLDYSKRPAIVRKIAQNLSKYSADFSIAAYGSSVFGEHTPSIFDGCKNLSYKGPYDGFASLPTEEFGIFLYTSWCDGIPNVLLEAMAAGFVVIAPDVGGISEVITDEKTGILLPSLADDDEMALHYTNAIRRISSDQEMARNLANSAISFLQDRNSYDVYDKKIAELFGNGN